MLQSYRSLTITRWASHANELHLSKLIGGICLKVGISFWCASLLVIHINQQWESKPWEFTSPTTNFGWWVFTPYFYDCFVSLIQSISCFKKKNIILSGYIGICAVLSSKASCYHTSYGAPSLQAASCWHCKHFVLGVGCIFCLRDMLCHTFLPCFG